MTNVTKSLLSYENRILSKSKKVGKSRPQIEDKVLRTQVSKGFSFCKVV